VVKKNDNPDTVKLLLRLCNLLKRQRQLSNVYIGHLKDLALQEDERLLRVLRFMDHKSLVAELEVCAELQAKVQMEAIFTGETLEGSHLLATLGVGKVMNRKDVDNQALVYGEVEFDPFVEVLTVACDGIDMKRKFVDLGHGIGRATIITALISEFELIQGFEVIDGLYKKSEEIARRFRERSVGSSPVIDLHLDSFLGESAIASWIDADLVFANSTCFPDELILRLEELCKGLRPGARIITFTTQFKSYEHFKLLFQKRLFMSWGPTTVFIHERKPPLQPIVNAEPFPPFAYQKEMEDEWVRLPSQGEKMPPPPPAPVPARYDDFDTLADSKGIVTTEEYKCDKDDSFFSLYDEEDDGDKDRKHSQRVLDDSDSESSGSEEQGLGMEDNEYGGGDYEYEEEDSYTLIAEAKRRADVVIADWDRRNKAFQ